jgi:hypothetical protein
VSDVAAPAPAAAPAAAPAPAAPAQRTTVEDRAQDLIERYQAEDATSESAAAEAPEQPSTPLDGPGTSAADSGAAKPDINQITQDRLARIAKVRASHDAERQKRAREQQQRQQSQAQTGEVESLRQQLAELQPLANIPKSEEALLGWAETQGMSVEKLVQYMRQRLTDPNAIAQRQVKTEADQLREEMRKQREEFEAWKRQTEEAEQQRVAQYQSQQKAHSFLQRTHASSETHPLSAAFLAKFGPQGMVAYANQFVAPLLREDYDVEELHDHVEQLLFETQLSSAPAAPTPAQPASTPSAKNGAGQPVTTLGNAVAAERGTVREDIPLHKMSLDDRAEFLKAKYQREQ